MLSSRSNWIGIFLLVIVLGFIGTTLFQGSAVAQGEWHSSIKVGTPDPAYMTLWSDQPVLEQVPGQTYYGRIVFRVWDRDVLTSHTSYPDEPDKTAYLLEHALLALQSVNSETPILTTMPWPDEPQEDLPGQAFLGWVAVEIWNNEAVVAITGPSQPLDLANRSAQELHSITLITR